jgi:hypothetical protein
MHCFPNPAPGKLLFPEAVTTRPSDPPGLLHPRARTRMCRQANPADRETSQDSKAVEVGANQGCKYYLGKIDVYSSLHAHVYRSRCGSWFRYA